MKKENLKCYVVASGVTYGNGETETVFNTRFKSAWLQKPARLTYYGEGENLVPTIHVQDLVSLVRKVYESKPEKKYLFAIDNTEDRKQLSLIQSISSGIGTKKVRTTDGRIDKVRPTDFSLNLPGRECSTLSINLNLTPSSLMVADPKAEDAEPVEFEWHCEKGLAANIEKVKNEFCD